jgi:hypothetical protein
VRLFPLLDVPRNTNRDGVFLAGIHPSLGCFLTVSHRQMNIADSDVGGHVSAGYLWHDVTVQVMCLSVNGFSTSVVVCA